MQFTKRIEILNITLMSGGLWSVSAHCMTLHDQQSLSSIFDNLQPRPDGQLAALELVLELSVDHQSISDETQHVGCCCWWWWWGHMGAMSSTSTNVHHTGLGNTPLGLQAQDKALIMTKTHKYHPQKLCLQHRKCSEKSIKTPSQIIFFSYDL